MCREGAGRSPGDCRQLDPTRPLLPPPGAGGSVIKSRLSGRAHQLPGDLRGRFTFSNTMSAVAFALSSPLEDGAESREEKVL